MSKIKNHYDSEWLLAHGLIGGKWKLRILWHIQQGDNRFSILVKVIPDITQKVLSVQLKELEESGILIKEIISEKTPKVILYRINENYISIIPVLETMSNFTREYGYKNGLIHIANNQVNE